MRRNAARNLFNLLTSKAVSETVPAVGSIHQRSFGPSRHHYHFLITSPLCYETTRIMNRFVDNESPRVHPRSLLSMVNYHDCARFDTKKRKTWPVFVRGEWNVERVPGPLGAKVDINELPVSPIISADFSLECWRSVTEEIRSVRWNEKARVARRNKNRRNCICRRSGRFPPVRKPPSGIQQRDEEGSSSSCNPRVRFVARH